MIRWLSLILIIFFVWNFSFAQSDAPYVIIHPSKINSGQPVFVLFTGDGGWHTFDQKLTDSLNAQNISVIAINSLKFFRKRKTPQQTVDSILPVINKYMHQWKSSKIILAGYSFGAEVVPFVYSSFDAATKKKTVMLVLITPSDNSDFKTNLTDRLGMHLHNWKYKVFDELEKITDKSVLIFWGDKERKYTHDCFYNHNFTITYVKGGHNFKDATPLIREILFQLH